MELKKILMYYGEWLLPLTMGPFYILNKIVGWDFFSSYIVASLIGATIFYPVNRWIFKHKCEAITIKINGKIYQVEENSEIKL